MGIKFILYPPICTCCKKLLDVNIDYDGSSICNDCLQMLRGYIKTKNICTKCSKPLNLENKIEVKLCKCSDCIDNGNKFYFEKNICALEYSDEFKFLLTDFKFGYNKNIASTFVKILEDYFLENKEFFSNFDLITYVPIHKDRQKYRGFNQSELLTRQICLVVDKPFYKDILIKNKSTHAQTTVAFDERAENVSGAFGVNKNFDIKDKNVLIIDDIFTTGSTLNECAKTLLNYGCKNVVTFTFLTSARN